MKIVLAIIKKEDKVLLVKRKEPQIGQGNAQLGWVFPGGKIEEGENPEAAIEREVLEETGYTVEAQKKISERQHPEFEAEIEYWSCDLTSDERLESKDEAIENIEWVQAYEIRKMITSDLDQGVAEYIFKDI